jgi:hypothetical protein
LGFIASPTKDESNVLDQKHRSSLPWPFLMVNNGSSISVGSDQAMRCVMCHYVLQVHNVVAPQEIKRSLSLWIMTIKQLQWINTLLLCKSWACSMAINVWNCIEKGGYERSKQHVSVGYDAIIEHFKNVNPYKCGVKKFPWRSSILHCERLLFDLYYWEPLDVVTFDFQVKPSNCVSKSKMLHGRCSSYDAGENYGKTCNFYFGWIH